MAIQLTEVEILKLRIEYLEGQLVRSTMQSQVTQARADYEYRHKINDLYYRHQVDLTKQEADFRKLIPFMGLRMIYKPRPE